MIADIAYIPTTMKILALLSSYCLPSFSPLSLLRLLFIPRDPGRSSKQHQVPISLYKVGAAVIGGSISRVFPSRNL